MLKCTHYISHVLKSGKRQTMEMIEYSEGKCQMGIRNWKDFDEAWAELELLNLDKLCLDRTHYK